MAECSFQLLIFACHHSVQKATVFKANHLICHEAIKKKSIKKTIRHVISRNSCHIEAVRQLAGEVPDTGEY